MASPYQIKTFYLLGRQVEHSIRNAKLPLAYQRSAEAAKNTAELIEGSQKNSENGVNASTEVGKILEQIIEGVEKVTQLIAEVAAASDEQSQGIDQVNNAVAQMDKVTHQNAANSEESASASEELSGQAQNLTAMVNELVNIVGGSSGAKANSGNSFGGNGINVAYTNTKAQTHAALHHGKNGNGGHAQNRRKKKAAKLLVSGGHQEVSPEQVIPLDNDQELKEF